MLLDTGLQVDVSAAWRQRGPALKVGILGVLIPLTFGSILSLGLPVHYHATTERPILFALFLGTTMSISALAIMARVLYDLDLIKSDLGLLTLCGYAVNDLLAWVIFSLLLALAAASTVALPTTALFVGLTFTFTTLCLTLGRRVVDFPIAGLTAHMPHQPGIVFTFVCCLGLSCGVTTHGLGLNALFGFLIAGMMAGEARTLSERTRHIMSQMVHALFVPLYFASVGLRFDFFADFDADLAVFVTVVSIVGKFLGAWIGTLGTSLSRADRLSVGIAFTPGGVTEIILAKAALDAQIFTVPVFVAVVVAAVFSSLLVGPLLMWSIRRRRTVDMLEFFVRRTAVPYLRSTTRWEVIEELCHTLTPYTPTLEPAELAQAVRTQEELMGTGRGEGIAIPYARIEALQKPILTVGYSPSRSGVGCAGRLAGTSGVRAFHPSK